MLKLFTSSKLPLVTVLASSILFSAIVVAQTPTRTPTETVREFYKALREKRFKEAFGMSIYKPAIDALSEKEFEELKPDFDKMSVAVTERIPADLSFTGEQISGDTATVFLKVLDADGKEKVEPATLIKIGDSWIVGDRENLELVKKAGKQFFFEARINAHHNDVQDMMTRISLAQVVYSQGHNGQFANLTELVTSGLVPKDIEGIESTGYRFQILKTPDSKAWYSTAEPAQYGKTGRLSFYLDSSGVKSGDNGGKPLVLKN